MNTNPVGWFEIYVQDMNRAKAFYESVFQVKLSKIGDDQVEMWAFPMKEDCYGAPGGLIHVPEVPSGGNSVIVYFKCEDCAVEADMAAKAGGKIEREKFSIGQYGFVSLVVDTEGNMIGLHSMK